MQSKSIMVSICCLAYNHENYIKDALDSFLMQNTEFRYEILIHDDASTDRTADIIREYEKKYPDIVKPIYQTENQYSKGKKITIDIQFPRVQGKYIAMCEGDDYWTDVNKLQRQVEYMENHPECSLCVHSSEIVDVNKNILEKHIPYSKECTLNTEEVIQQNGDLFSTNTMLFRAQYVENLPSFYMNAHVGDYPLTIYLSLCGQIYYTPKMMSAYRKGVPGSWSENEKINMQQSKINVEKLIELYNSLDEYTQGKYRNIIEPKVRELKDILRKKEIIINHPRLYSIYRRLFRS